MRERERERERDSMSRGGAEREREKERIPSRLHAVTGPDMELDFTTDEIIT